MPKLLYVTERTFYPDSIGGAVRSTLFLLQALVEQGWQVEVLCTRRIRSPHFQAKFWQSFRQGRIPFPTVRDDDLGYPCWRLIAKFANQARFLKVLDKHLNTYQPDVVLGDNDPRCCLLNHAVNRGYLTFYFARVAEYFERENPIAKGIHVIANSPFVAAIASKITGQDVEVILPFVDRSQYEVRDRQRQYIVFINPVPQKGLEVANQIVRQLPEENFLFVKGKWFRYLGKEDEFLADVRDLPNVTIWENQSDMRRVYKVTDILLVPSHFKETFGRVIVEAHINGIPVVAAKVGGIPFTLGEGGILVESPHNPAEYVAALQRLRHDPDLYAALSAKAYENSQRPEFDPHDQVNRFLQIVAKYRTP
ncbi:glycosyltransferase family 4 protein [Trichothermofontia sp.]